MMSGFFIVDIAPLRVECYYWLEINKNSDTTMNREFITNV